jgi:hypothetical protein
MISYSFINKHNKQTQVAFAPLHGSVSFLRSFRSAHKPEALQRHRPHQRVLAAQRATASKRLPRVDQSNSGAHPVPLPPEGQPDHGEGALRRFYGLQLQLFAQTGSSSCSTTGTIKARANPTLAPAPSLAPRCTSCDHPARQTSAVEPLREAAANHSSALQTLEARQRTTHLRASSVRMDLSTIPSVGSEGSAGFALAGVLETSHEERDRSRTAAEESSSKGQAQGEVDEPHSGPHGDEHAGDAPAAVPFRLWERGRGQRSSTATKGQGQGRRASTAKAAERQP